jgi:hypothetical protein
MRKKPEYADFYGWADFETYADNNGIGDDFGDWASWWYCWVEAFKSAMK